MGGNANADLYLFERLLVPQIDSRKSLWLRRMQAILRRLHMLEMLFHEFDKMFVIEIPRGAYDEIAGSEVVPIKARYHRPLEFLYRVARP
jgi:hypothetical protein